MTKLSVNVNKIALLRNSRGRDYPNLIDFAKKYIELGAQGITIHPRPDERHVKATDALDLTAMLAEYPDIELNIEGYPSEDFLKLVERCKPDQCTLVPDTADQLTSDHGWDFFEHGDYLSAICARLKKLGVRTAVFIDPDLDQVRLAAESGIDRIELYTESFASLFGTPQGEEVFQCFKLVAAEAQRLGLGVNAGHDLDLANLSRFLEIEGILEVSIGHALTVESVEQGRETVMRKYVEICAS